MQRCPGQFDYDDAPELLQVKGIGPQAAVELMAMGIRTLEDLAMADSGAVEDERLVRWAKAARQRIASRADKRIGDSGNQDSGNRRSGDQGLGE